MRSKNNFVGRTVCDLNTGDQGVIMAKNGVRDVDDGETLLGAYEVKFWDGTRLIPAAHIEDAGHFRLS